MDAYDKIAGWLNAEFLGNTFKLWTAALLTVAASFLILRFLRTILVARIKSLADRTVSKMDDIVAATLAKTHVLFILALSLLAGSTLLEMGRSSILLRQVVVIVALLQAGIWASVLLTGFLSQWRERRLRDASSTAAIVAFGFLGKLAVWSIVVILALDNLGVEVTALLAGLGVGGIAVALAVQNVLGDLLASVSIILDKPFEVGDFIIVGDLMGTVENIGLKTTRVRSLSGEQVVFSNSDMLSSRIRNFKRMFERRVVFPFGVTYQTPYEKLAAIPPMVRGIIEAQPKTRFDRAHFQKYGDSSLDFEVVYYVTAADYNLYMDIQQAINLAIFKRFQDEHIDFAYPTRTLYVQGIPGGPAPSPGPQS